jgi:hypothetical protein
VAPPERGEAVVNLRWLTRKDVEITVFCENEDESIEGSFSSGDDEADAAYAEEIRADLENNAWAWCCIRVNVAYEEYSEDEYLGCCSYKSEADFRACDYYDSMVNEALERLRGPVPPCRDAFAEEAWV